MSKELVREIKEQTIILLYNIDTTIKTCDMSFILCDMPIWKHVYHMLHSLDQWFINPNQYEHPTFHMPDLNSLEIKSDKALSRIELATYFNTIQLKINDYLDTLTDDMLYEKPDGCQFTRLTLILGQYRHLNCHLGNINATTIIKTGKWPRVVGLDGDFTKGLYEE